MIKAYLPTLIFTLLVFSPSRVFVHPDVIYQLPRETSSPVKQQASPGKLTPQASAQKINLSPRENKSFWPGESLKFIIKYEFIGAGNASMEVKSGDPVDGRPTWHIVSEARSNGFVDAFFKVRDVNSSVIDSESLASVSFHQNLKEGHYHVIRNTKLNYETGTYQYERIYKGKTNTHDGTIQEPLQDILSAFFYTRTMDLELGKEYDIRVFSDRDVYPLKVKVHPKLQNISVPAGKFSCMRIDPELQGDAIFKAKEGKMTIWLTNDERKMPVLLRSRVFVGAFDAELISFENGGKEKTP